MSLGRRDPDFGRCGGGRYSYGSGGVCELLPVQGGLLSVRGCDPIEPAYAALFPSRRSLRSCVFPDVGSWSGHGVILFRIGSGTVRSGAQIQPARCNVPRGIAIISADPSVTR